MAVRTASATPRRVHFPQIRFFANAYGGKNSIPINLRSILMATYLVVPVPQKGSSTVLGVHGKSTNARSIVLGFPDLGRPRQGFHF
jgi:hypothetical protein